MTTINDDELLSIRLAMEELQLARETVFGKCSADSDIGAALDLQAHELAIALTSATDRHMSQSIANAQRTDGVIIDQMESIQAQEEADHALARSLANSVESERQSPQDNTAQSSSSSGPLSLEQSSSLSDDISGSPCDSCYKENIPAIEMRNAPCGHKYCRKCMMDLWKSSLADRFLIPVRCCKQEFPIDWAREVLTAPELLKYETFLNEFNDIKNGGTASSSSSSSSEILVDNDYELTVTKLGGKICRRCHRGVQKREGCNHMTCLCSHQFCYSCGANWTPRRECSCSLFTEAEVNRMVDEVAPLAHGRERLNLVNIYQHHDQHVHRWRRIPINQTVDRRLKRCRTCVWVCNMWYHQCITCLEIRCTRCTRNRD